MLAAFAHDKLSNKSAHLLKIVLVDIKTSLIKNHVKQDQQNKKDHINLVK